MQANLKLNKPKPRLARIERLEPPRVSEDENAHLWAVSYSDFLMTVLSFFILFYSVDDSKRKTFILNLAKEFSTTSQIAQKEGEKNDGAAKDSPDRMPAHIVDSLANFKVKIDHENEILVVNFVDNFFGPGQYKIKKENDIEIREMLTRLKVYDGKVNLYFEGHADTQPMHVHKGEVLLDNFVLSSLRASSALRIAKDVGFSEKNLFIQADSSNIRNSRSLSIRIEPRGLPQ